MCQALAYDANVVRALNDQFRHTLLGGRVVLTAGVVSLGNDAVQLILSKVRSYDDFGSADDPYGEHDFGSVEHAGHRVFFKIDYYDRSLEYGSPNPADPDVTSRVLTIMLASEF